MAAKMHNSLLHREINKCLGYQKYRARATQSQGHNLVQKVQGSLLGRKAFQLRPEGRGRVVLAREGSSEAEGIVFAKGAIR